MINNISPKLGKKTTFLNQSYRNFITLQFPIYSSLDEEALEVYDTLLTLLTDNKLYYIVDEIKYRVTDGENLNSVFIDILESHKDLPLLITSYHGILLEIENKYWISKFI